MIYSLLSRQWPSWSSLSEGPWPVHRLNKDWFLLISSIIARFSCFKELVRWSFKTLVELWPVCPCSSSSHTQSRGVIPQTDERFFIEKNESCTHIVLTQIWKVTFYRTLVFIQFLKKDHLLFLQPTHLHQLCLVLSSGVKFIVCYSIILFTIILQMKNNTYMRIEFEVLLKTNNI